MEGGEGSGFDSAPMKRRRSSAARRPRAEGGPAADQRDNTASPPSPSASSRAGPRRLLLTSDENTAGPDGGNRRREFLLNAPSPERATKGSIRLRSEAAGGGARKSSDGSSLGAHVAPEGNRGSSPAVGKPGKVKLKIKNVLSKPNPDAADSRSSPAKPPRPVDSRHQQKTEGAKDSDRSTSSRDKKTRKERSIEEAMAQEQSAKFQREQSSDPVRKSRRLAKKSVTDNELDEGYDTSNIGTPEDWDGNALELKSKGGSSSKKNASKKAKNRSKAYEVDNEFATSRSSRDGKKRSRESADDDNTEEELTSDSEPDAEDEQKTASESPANVRSEPLTTRRRALQSWMDGSSTSTVEFPDGLPLAPSRSKKDKLSEEEMLAKKAEAAQRRKMIVEKATKESEAEAIRKILGMDSEKKKEERKQKEREEKERATRAQNIVAGSIRWVTGPTGNVVSFPHAVGLPSIFNSKPHSYPPPREKCAGPECTNAYKYRHSKLNLPLCSLKCYKAVQGNA
ncbi:hypothetical protein BAE44_0015795 [Dichanthelium oligosanthes]|uniref:INO80 complex subunit B-like conserved region domain-containing protein n=1 Tax=Dichanthelium oligosanthes TaxID=888268 RepID=A0A1E5VDF5_9POAL|nr:hypothetical protein BAE44_0015795 [Dichanthelium oligosanthes]